MAIEHRRDACQQRQTHLADLRRIVADGGAWTMNDDGNVMEEGGSQGSHRLPASIHVHHNVSDRYPQAGAGQRHDGRLTYLEQEHRVLKQQVLDFERDRSIPNGESSTLAGASAQEALQAELLITIWQIS